MKNGDDAFTAGIKGATEAGEFYGGASEGVANIDIKKKEFIILNTEDKSRTMVYKSSYKKLVKPLLMGCFKYLQMSKEDKKVYDDFDNIEKAIGLADECY
ncbi:MAG: hypothetical protein AB8B61_01590 [Cyclobacteriaceae bacterium]